MDIVTYKMAQKYAETAVQNVNNAVTELDNRLATNRTEILRRALITETGNKIELEINNQTYILTAKLYDKNNNLISTSNSIDLPLEAMIINATYNNNTKKIVLTLQSGSTIEFSIVDLIDGLVNETTFNETIEELEAENIKLKQRISDLENNESINTVSGESIDIDDSANATIRNIKITGKSVQDGTPTPENPVEIQNCSGSISFKLHNKNLFLFDDIENPDANYISSGGGTAVVQYSESEKGFYTTNHRRKIIKLGAGDYIISMNSKSRSGSSAYTILMSAVDTTRVKSDSFLGSCFDLSLLNNSYTRLSKKISIPNGYNALQLTFYNTLFWNNIQIEKGDTETDYVAHEEQKITFPLQSGQVLAQDDYLADDGIHKSKGHITLTGQENWTENNISFQTENFFPQDVALRTVNTKAFSNKYIYSYRANGISNNIDNLCFGWSATKILTIRDDDYNTTVEWETYLAEQYANGTPIIIEYELSEEAQKEAIEPYTEEQQKAWEQIKALRTYKNITHISSEDETKPTLEVTYVKDLPKEIDILGHHETKTQAQYDALVSGGTVDSNTYYYIVEE